jgi:ABC-2 type transport system permease protein
MLSLGADIREDLIHTYINVRYELRKHFRRKRIILSIVLALVIPTMFYIIPKARNVDFASTSISFMSNSLAFISYLIIISAAMFAGDAVSGEFEKRTALLSLSTPQRRSSIFIGKYIAALLAVFAIVAFYFVICSIEVLGIYGLGAMPEATGKSFLLCLLYSTSVVSMTFFYSSILKGVMSSTLLSFFTFLMILPIVSALLEVASVDPWFIVTYAAGLTTNVFVQPPAFGGGGGGARDRAAASFTSYTPNFTVSVEVMAAYAIIMFILAMVIAVRKDVE